MELPRAQLGIAAGAGAVLLLGFFVGLAWLNRQGPVLSRSDARDPLSGIPVSIKLNPLRDRASERVAAKFIRGMRDGQCQEQLATWLKDYRRKYATFLCESESRHPLVSWQVAEWEDTPPLRILHYRGQRRVELGRETTYSELFSVTLQDQAGEWMVTKYDAMY